MAFEPKTTHQKSLPKTRLSWFGMKLTIRMRFHMLMWRIGYRLTGLYARLRFQFAKHELRAVIGTDKGWVDDYWFDFAPEFHPADYQQTKVN